MGVKAVEDPVAESEKNLCDLCVSAVKQFQVIELFFTAEAQRTRRDGGGEFNDLPQGDGRVLDFGFLIFYFGLSGERVGRRPLGTTAPTKLGFAVVGEGR